MDCPYNCQTCLDETGTCEGCNETYELLETGECACSEGLYDNGSECLNCEGATYFDGATCAPCPDYCLECMEGTGMCSTCQETFSFDENGYCFCDSSTSYVNEDGNCVELPTCADNEFFTGVRCSECGDRCATCEDLTGICTTCTEADLVLDTMTCKCSDEFFDNTEMGTCDAYVTCADGEYVDQTTNACVACAEGCALCTDGTGACTECTDPNFTIDSAG